MTSEITFKIAYSAKCTVCGGDANSFTLARYWSVTPWSNGWSMSARQEDIYADIWGTGNILDY